MSCAKIVWQMALGDAYEQYLEGTPLGCSTLDDEITSVEVKQRHLLSKLLHVFAPGW